jgi:hypothetical protein
MRLKDKYLEEMVDFLWRGAFSPSGKGRKEVRGQMCILPSSGEGEPSPSSTS